MKKHIAFTLAEVLITLGIIGVVSALTIPTVTANYQKKVYVARLQKVYNQLSNALFQLMAEEKANSFSETSLADSCSASACDGLKNFMNTYFSVVKDCGIVTSSGTNDCFATKYSNLNGTSYSKVPSDTYFTGSPFYCVMLNTGASLCLLSTACAGDTSTTSVHIHVDVNGKSGPNVSGRDLFTFSYSSDGKLSVTSSNSNYCSTSQKGVPPVIVGQGCFDKIINAGWVMDY